MNVASWVKKINSYFRDAGFELYLVGGAVRNLRLNCAVDEWDFTTNALPDDIEKIFRSATVKNVYTVGKKFGTIGGEYWGEKIEVTSFRSEQYQVNDRRPVVTFGTSLEGDLERRDFTINALAYDISNDRLIDIVNGVQDLAARVVRAVGDPDKRFSEDPLRLLRAIRFATVLDFEIDERTYQSIITCRDNLASISAERIAQEMNKLLLSQKPSRGVQLLVETGLISYILPELIPSIDLKFDPSEHKDIYQHILQVTDQTPPKLELRWCALLHDIAKPITRKKINGEYYFLGHENVGAGIAKTVLRRLKYPSDFVQYVAKLVRMHQRLPNYDKIWSDGAIRRFVREAGEALDDLFVFASADFTGSNIRKKERYEQNRAELRQKISELEKLEQIAKIKSPLSGEELMKLFNRPPGPWIKPIKEHLLSMVLDGKLAQNDIETAENIVLSKDFMKKIGESKN